MTARPQGSAKQATGEEVMKLVASICGRTQEGKIGYILLWLLGVPLPILFLIFLLRGCQ
jgi:hypothetical protein